MTAPPEIYFSFFMFTVDLRPADTQYTRVLVEHLRAVSEMGYDGVDVHIAAPPEGVDPAAEVESYARLKEAFDRAGLGAMRFATNVGTTRTFDPTSPYREQRQQALRYLKSRVDITAALGGPSIMSGPFVYPYGVFPTTDAGAGIWSDALLDWMQPRYEAARPVIQALAEYALENGVTLAIEPVKSWETPPPNMVSEVLDFLDGVEAPCGITVDTAQALMESQGPSVFTSNLARAVEKDRLQYIHISAPDRGAVHDSWIPWDVMLRQIAPVYRGPYLVEVFNAIPPLDSSMRMARRRFWRPGEDAAEPGCDSAYDVALAGLRELRQRLADVAP